MNPSNDLIVQVELLPLANIRQRQPAKIIDRREALLRHPPKQTILHVFDDAIAIVHRRGTHLHGAAAEQNKLRRIAPTSDTANARERKSARRIGLYLLNHIQRNRLYRGTAVAAMRTLAVDVRTWLRMCRDRSP